MQFNWHETSNECPKVALEPKFLFYMHVNFILILVIFCLCRKTQISRLRWLQSTVRLGIIIFDAYTNNHRRSSRICHHNRSSDNLLPQVQATCEWEAKTSSDEASEASSSGTSTGETHTLWTTIHTSTVTLSSHDGGGTKQGAHRQTPLRHVLGRIPATSFNNTAPTSPLTTNTLWLSCTSWILLAGILTMLCANDFLIVIKKPLEM